MAETIERGRVWILEDSPLEGEMARRALASHHDISLYEDGSVVLEKMANGSRPDVLVLDSQLLGVSGLEVCRAARQRFKATDLPILMLTVHGGQTDVLEALHAGANDYVVKPYHVAELAARVTTLVRTARLVSEQLTRTKQLALAADVGAALTQHRTATEVARHAAEAIARHLDPCEVEIWTKTGGELRELGRAGSGAVQIPRSLVERVFDQSPPSSAGERTEVAVVLPLIVRSDIVGAIAIAPRDVRLGAESLAAVTSLVALGLARARAEEDRAVLLERERAARGDAEAANRSKDDFLATVSHELRTPLNAITGWTSMLLGGNLDPARVRRAYETIDRNARSQAQLIDDLLDIGRITSGTLRLEQSIIEIGSIAEMALESIRPTAEARGVSLDSGVNPDLGTIKGDGARVQQVIWNLLSNAIKFTARGGHVALAVTREERGVVITVTDDGQGIAPEFLPRVFDRFRQEDGSSTRSRGGLGLGLSIVRHLVELHGGTIDASSEGIGQGARFTVVLPAEGGRPGTSSAVVRPARSMAIDPPREVEGLRVLVLDDEPDARELLRTLLEGCKVVVTTAASVEEAMAALAQRNIDVILSDIAMPGEDGHSFVRRVRALTREEGGRTPAVALTAYARLEDRTRALRAGFNAHVAKPVEPSELLAVLLSLASR